MSIEIKELVIRAQVTDNSSKLKKSESIDLNQIKMMKEEILRECKKIIKQHLKEEKGR
jgi:hypothetical protein